MSREGKLVVISGPSGVGKSTVCERMLRVPGFERVVTATTRSPREGEKNGRDYRFMTRAEFESGLKTNRYLEHATVHGELYGTPREDVERGIQEGNYVLLNIDVQGAAELRRQPGLSNHMVSVFLLPPSQETLHARLNERATEAPDRIAARLRAASEEMEEKVHYDHQVVNGDLDTAVEEILKLVGYDATLLGQNSGLE